MDEKENLVKLIINPLSNITRRQQLCTGDFSFFLQIAKWQQGEGIAEASPLIGLMGGRVGTKFESNYANIRSAEL